MRSQTTKNIKVLSSKSFTLDSRLSGKLLIYVYKKAVDTWFNPDANQLWLSTVEILVYSENLFDVFEIKKNWSKSEDHPFYPNSFSYKYALSAILDQKI